MNTPRDSSKLHDDAERLVAQSLHRAGARFSVPPELSQSVELEVSRAWRDTVHKRSIRHTVRTVAACLVLTAIGVLAWKSPAWLKVTARTAGILVASKGPVEFGALGSTQRIVGGQALSVGTTIRTAPQGRVLLAFGPVSLRIAGASEARLINSETLELASGAVYVDSHGSEKHFAIVTSRGRVEHVGTQYQVRVSKEALTVGVREGQVRIALNGPTRELGERRALYVSRTGEIKLISIAPFGEFWRWTEDVRPDFPIEGRTLSDLLQWYAEETGREIQYADAATRTRAAATRINGSISDLSPADALQAVVAASRFEHFIQPDGSVLISLSSDVRDKLLSNGADSSQVPRLPRAR